MGEGVIANLAGVQTCESVTQSAYGGFPFTTTAIAGLLLDNPRSIYRVATVAWGSEFEPISTAATQAAFTEHSAKVDILKGFSVSM
ncbi:MAG: hypothetical protein ACFB0G_21940 [Leptolyngbyaceae cyanobacterium]